MDEIMYKKQMKFQKLICYALLVVSALVFVYSLGLVTDLYDAFSSTIRNPDKIYSAKVEGAWIFYEIQPFNSQLTTASLILIGCSVLAFATNTHSRRKYYIANYVSVAISSVANVAVAVWSIINVAKFRHQFQTTVDFEALKEYSEKWDTLYIDPSQTFWFDIGFVISALLIAVALLAIVNMIWKIQLMKEEKRLIEGGV